MVSSRPLARRERNLPAKRAPNDDCTSHTNPMVARTRRGESSWPAFRSSPDFSLQNEQCFSNLANDLVRIFRSFLGEAHSRKRQTG